jgi:ABC-type antimicrobial peptide transport system permease subunit
MLDAIRSRLRALFQRKQVEQDLNDELGYHLEKALQQNIARGMSAPEAQREAHLGLGGVEQIKEASRDARGVRLFDDLYRDLRYGARMLAKHRGLTLVIVLTLGLGIGANTAIFSLLDALLTRELPVKSPRELVFVQRYTAGGGVEQDFSYPAFERLRDANRSLAGIFALDTSRVSATIDGQPQLVVAGFVSGSYFDVLGIGAALGRTFTAADDRPGGAAVAVVSFAFWQNGFAGDPSIVGKTVYLGRIPFSIIGVTPPGFYGLRTLGNAESIMLPMFVHPKLGLADHDTFDVVGRLKPGISQESAGADLDVIYQQFLTDAAGPVLTGEAQRKISSERIELASALRGFTSSQGDFAKDARILFAVVAIVLLIASVNIANLLLARAASRQKEMGVRLAIVGPIRQQVGSIEKDLPLLNIQTAADEIAGDFVEERALATLIGLFGILALGLASIGLYGTLSYTVGSRTKELGVRMALGAKSRDVLWMVLAETFRMVAIGALAGIPVALLASRLISSLLYGVSRTDPITISAAVIVMLSTASIAAFIPARRASRVDPATALRHE